MLQENYSFSKISDPKLAPVKMSHCLNPDFKYTHSNPYHDKLSDFKKFVMRDEETENHRGEWNTKIFENRDPVHLEIGTGYGHFMMDFLKDNPTINFVGMDFRFKRSFKLAKKLNELSINNFRYLRAKGERIQFIFAENEIQNIYYFFPDPWPKKRHHKNRLFNRVFLENAYQTLNSGGQIFIKTDHDEYFEWMVEVASQCPLFEITFQTINLRKDHPEHFLAQYKTKFEKMFIERGLTIKAMVLRSKKALS